MDVQPLDRAEAWQLVPAPPDAFPRTWPHPSWQGERPARYRTRERSHGLTVWLGGAGTANEPWVLELSVPGRWPNLAEIRGAMLALTTEGAMFQPLFPYLAAVPFDEIPPFFAVQTTAVPGSEAERRLQLSGGLTLDMRTGKPVGGAVGPGTVQ